MENHTYITEEEYNKCKKVASAFAELYKIEPVLVLDAYPYGFVKLQDYHPIRGFESITTYTDSQTMFNDLCNTWLDTKLYQLALDSSMVEIVYKDVYNTLTQSQKNEILGKKDSFAQMAGIS